MLVGGTASGTVVSSGGRETVSSGGAAAGTSLLSGGKLDELGFTYAAGGAASVNSATDVLTVTEGGKGYTVSLQGNYTGDVLTHSQDASASAP